MTELARRQARTGATAAVPALYDVRVRHVRHAALARDFQHRVYLWLVDLDALPRLPVWLRPFAGFRAADHLGDPAASIRANVDRYLAGHGVDLRGGQVLMLANARVLGHVVNPLTVYWCHDADGALVCVVAEVHNTYGERHCYLLRTDAHGRARTDKEFYVSPFLPVAGEYRMRLAVPDERVALAVTLRQDAAPALTATVIGARRPATPTSLLGLLLRRPLVTLRTSALIRRHGVALWLHRLPVVPRPPHPPQKGVA